MKYVIIVIIMIVIGCTEISSRKINEQENVVVDTSAQNVQNTGADASSSSCPSDMVKITGNFCTNLEEICLKWLDKPSCNKIDPVTKECLSYNLPMRCGEFKKPTVCLGKTVSMNFCIDKYEYPNQLGIKPKLRNTWYEAKTQCESQGKRLCIDNEWTQACRGNENLPYPYGYVRDATACRIDLPWQDPNTHTFEQLDKTVPAGSMPGCVSPYGVFDMTGNGDEYAISSGNSPFISVLKGGHAYSVRNRCSPRTEAHSPDFSYYVTGFRCCKNL